MLPPQQHHSNKRTNHHRSNHIGYHPYYSSSPVGISNGNIHYVSTSSVSSSTTTSITSDTLKKETTLTQNNINRHNNQYNTSKYSNDDLSNSQNNNNNTLQEDENDISYISTKTNPPTTPVSLSSVNNTPSTSNTNEILTSPICSFKTKDFKTFTNEPILNVTPVTSISSASSVSNMKLNHYSASCSSSCSTVDSTCSSVHATFSRSGSMNSLNSFDIKSTYSSIPSEYSCNNNKQENCAGFMTPSSYSDLPDSPGELFPANIIHNRFINSSSLNNSANNQQRYLSNNKLMNQTSLNEISVMTVDSNPSKSNDITIVERTVLACTAANSSNNTQLMATYGNSGCTTFNQDEFNNNNVSLLNEDDERVVSYDVEGSLCESHSTRSNVSSLTFPSEPTADLAFIRNLLTKKGSIETASFVNNELVNATKANNQIQTKQWSNYSNKTNLFTPPIKLNSIVNSNNQNLVLKTNKKLLYEDDEYVNNDDEIVAEEEDDCARSIASLPSDIVRDNDLCLKQNKFNALFSKLTNNLTLTNDKNYESSPLINNNKANFQFNSKKPNQSLDNSMNFSNNQSFNSVYHSSLIENNTTNYQEHALTNKSKQFKKNDEDDEQILQDFIDEMLPIAMANKKEVDEYDETDESVNEQDEEQLKKLQKIYENNLENHVPLSNILPKIEEEDEDDDYVPKMREKLVSKSTNTSKTVVVQMTKTTRLRVNKLLQSKSISNALSSSNKKTNQIKENFSCEKKQALSNSTSLNSINSKCSNLTTKSSSNSNVSKKLVLTQSNKLNMIKPTTKRSNLLEKK